MEDVDGLTADAARTGPQRSQLVQAECQHLSTDVAVAEKVPWPEDTEAKSAWSQGVALLLQASERCSTLVKIASGAQADSVVNTASAGKEALGLVAQELLAAQR